jgi:hypothetical protein
MAIRCASDAIADPSFLCDNISSEQLAQGVPVMLPGLNRETELASMLAWPLH